MKKLFVLIVVAAAFAACNDNTKTNTSTKRMADSTAVTPAPAASDTAAMRPDTSAANMADTMNHTR